MHEIDALFKTFNPDCNDVLSMAQRELASFFAAVTRLFGDGVAELSAEDWLQEVEAANPLPASRRDWRQITLRACQRLASRMNSVSQTNTYATELCR